MFQPRTLTPFLAKSSDRGGTTADLVVLHWSAGHGEPDDVARYLLRTSRQASYHLVIGRDGDVLQLVDLSRAAWHAGDGRLDGTRPNPRSVGVCLCNLGPVPDTANVHEGQHWKLGIHSRRWERYPEQQVLALVRTLGWLKERLPSLALICGHEDLSRGKPDPGPALPWDQLLAHELGLSRWLGPWPARWPRT